MSRKWIYLTLNMVGILLPMHQFVPWVAHHGLDLPLFGQELFANRISSFFAVDVLVSAVVLLVFAFTERKRVRFWWVAALMTVLVGVSAGLPALLYFRETSRRAVDADV